MELNQYKRGIQRLVLFSFLGAASYIIIVVAANIIVSLHHDDDNARRLKILQSDAVFSCNVSRITPWHEREERNADAAGTTHGIGFGGRSLTSVTRLFSLNGTDPPNVIDALRVCAQSSGWTLVKQPGAALNGTKSFPDGWTAYLKIYIGSHTAFADQPIVQVSLTADPI
jgi:hypothetical protein